MDLNESQMAVVGHTEGPALVLAGPGSGKTTAITMRAARRLADGVEPRRMLMLTFTNKAAREMRDRLARFAGGDAALPLVTTFHSFGYRFIRKNPVACGRIPDPVIIPEKDQQRLMDSVADGSGLGADDLLDLYDAIKNEALDLLEDRAETAKVLRRFAASSPALDPDLLEDRAPDLLLRYEIAKSANNMLDFTDLIALPLVGLRSDPGLRDCVRKALLDVTVDEAQDTNLAQYLLLKEILPVDTPSVLVGDDDQSIYRWRGACPDNMKRFLDEYGAKTYRMGMNYRSAPEIVRLSDTLIRKNTCRLGKELEAANEAGSGGGIRPLHRHKTFPSMIGDLVARICEQIDEGAPKREIAVLCRLNAMAGPIRDALLDAGIPAEVRGETSLAERREAGMYQAMVRFIACPEDRLAAATLSEMVPGLGPASVDKALQAEISPFSPDARMSARARAGVDALKAFAARVRDEGPEALLDRLCDLEMFSSWLLKVAEVQAKASVRSRKRSKGGGPQTPAECYAQRMRTLRTLQRQVSEAQDGVTPSWTAAVEAVTLETADQGEGGEAVVVSTIHRAKGLEWDHVHVPGFSEQILPLAGPNGRQDLEEERSLAYVAITRARKSVDLYHANTCFLPNYQGVYLQPSRFLAEMKGQASGPSAKRKGGLVSAVL